MRVQKRSDTVPEVLLRKKLHALGYRFRINFAPLEGLPRRRADIVFTRFKLAVFVDGCFWHRCPIHATNPRSNSVWWTQKLDQNVARDRDTDAQLRASGWTVLRVWEHVHPTDASARIESVLSSLSEGSARP